jgi:hemerythrin superfamily protein
MNAIELLKQQHDEVEELFEQFEKARGAKKEIIFGKIADALAIHATIEEKAFYPSCKAEDTEELLREAVEEHLSVKRLLADAMRCEPDDPQFEAKAAVIKEQVLEHVKEEEKELFPMVKKLFSRDELEDLGVVMEDMARELAAMGSPREQVPSETGAPAPL